MTIAENIKAKVIIREVARREGKPAAAVRAAIQVALNDA